MVSITYATLTTLINQAASFAQTAEAIIDHSVNKLNGYLTTDNQISNMTGTPGTKTLTATSAQAGAIIDVAVAVYASAYKSAGSTSESFGIGGISNSSSSSQGGGVSGVDLLAERLARKLNIAADEAPIYLSNDPVPTE